jgi:hypothetical protein
MDYEANQLGNTPPPIGTRGFFEGVKFRPIVVGVIVDYVATLILSIVYVINYFTQGTSKDGTFSEESIKRAIEQALSSTEGLLMLSAIGIFCTALGGYIAARFAQTQEVKHGSLVGAVSLIVGIFETTMVGEAAPLPHWYLVIAYLVAIPAGALGGFLVFLQQEGQGES